MSWKHFKYCEGFSFFLQCFVHFFFMLCFVLHKCSVRRVCETRWVWSSRISLEPVFKTTVASLMNAAHWSKDFQNKAIPLCRIWFTGSEFEWQHSPALMVVLERKELQECPWDFTCAFLEAAVKKRSHSNNGTLTVVVVIIAGSFWEVEQCSENMH